jgi:hypothetical protein
LDQQLQIELAGGNIHPDIPLPDVPHPDVHLPDVLLPKACQDGCVSEVLISSRVVAEAMVVLFGLGSGSCLVYFLCSNLFISGIDYYTRHEVFGSLKVYFIYMFCSSFILMVIFYS